MANNEKLNPYVGTQTEKNLKAAFAGESEARNCFLKQLITRRSMQSSGSRNLTE